MSWVIAYYTQILGLYHGLCSFLLYLGIWMCNLTQGQRSATLREIFQCVLDDMCLSLI